MGFKLTQKPTFTTKVSVNIPNDRGGFDKSWFIARFKRLTTAELEELLGSGLSDEELVRRVLVDWEMKDEDTGEDVPFNNATLDAVMLIRPTSSVTARAFIDTVIGARAKN